MAHSLEKRIEAVRDVLSGEMSWADVARKHGVSKSTLSGWVRDAQRTVGPNQASEARRGGAAMRPSPPDPPSLPPPTTTPPSPCDPRPATRAGNRRAELMERLFDTLERSLEMLGNWADVAGDRSFIESNPNAAHELGKSVLERCDTLVSFIRPGDDE